MTSPQVGSRLYALVMFVAVSVLAGLLTAGLIVPFAAIGGSSATMVANSTDSLPADLETPPESMKSTVYLADGSVLADFYEENRIVVSMDDIAPIMRVAQLSIEDHRFYEHGAIDVTGTLRAFVSNSVGSSTQGGSTLTQQYVKQVQIEAATIRGDQAAVAEAQETTITRKIREMRYAIAVEQKFTKDQILERYLNIAYYGDGAYGVEAAAQHYFNKSAKDLTLGEAAMLAGIVQNPVAYNPAQHPEAAIERRNVVLARMQELTQIGELPSGATFTADDIAAAKAETFDPGTVQSQRNGCVGSRYPFLCDYVYRTLLDNSAFGGSTKAERASLIKRGGYQIYTMIDPSSQDQAQAALSAKIKATDPVVSTMVEVQPGTGLILAMAQNRTVMGNNADAGETYYNYAVASAMGGAEGYQAGSTFKAFTIAAALDKGISPLKTLNAAPTINFKGATFATCDGSFVFKQDYKVSNSTGANGVMNMYKGAQMSVNTFFLQMEQATGICQAAKMADLAGAKLSNGKLMQDVYSYTPSFTLGVAEVTPISMATAYATFAARGVRCDPIIVKEVKNRDGATMATQDANCQQVIAPEVADGVNDILATVMTDGTGKRVRLADGRPEAGKTGTIDSNAAVWFAGYTPEVAGVAMIAVDKDPRYKDFWAQRGGSLKGVRLPGIALEGSGSGDAGEIWQPAMTAALKNEPATGFTPISDTTKNGKPVAMPDIKGKSVSQIKQILSDAGFTVVSRKTYSDTSPSGTYLGTTCDQTVGGTCYMTYSNGPRPAAPATTPDQGAAPAAPDATQPDQPR